MKIRKQGSYQRGLGAELLAMALLALKGYRILAWRYKTHVGEIDIVARRRGILAFVEVKRRPSLAQALESTTPQMRRRIGRAASHFMRAHPRLERIDQRFDLIAVSGFSVRHLDNAWMEGPY